MVTSFLQLGTFHAFLPIGALGLWNLSHVDIVMLLWGVVEIDMDDNRVDVVATK